MGAFARERLFGHKEAALARDREQRRRLVAAQLAERRELQTEIRATRDRHAELLRDLRADRQEYRANMWDLEPDRRTPNIKSRTEHSATSAKPMESKKLTKTFEKSATPCPREPLRRLRESQIGSKRNPDQGWEPER